jgi:hypothetical protein
MSKRRIQINPAELQRLLALGYTHRQLAEHFGCCESTITRRLNPKTLEAAKRCHKRWKQRGPLPLVEYCCQWCHKLNMGKGGQRFCSKDCSNKWITYGQFSPQFSARQLREYVAVRGLSKESAQLLGYTLEQLRNAINDTTVD